MKRDKERERERYMIKGRVREKEGGGESRIEGPVGESAKACKCFPRTM